MALTYMLIVEWTPTESVPRTLRVTHYTEAPVDLAMWSYAWYKATLMRVEDMRCSADTVHGMKDAK